MSKSKKPRKAYRPRPVNAAATFTAIQGACKLDQAEVSKAVDGVAAALLNLQRGIEPDFQTRVLGDMLNVAEQLAELGICSDAESREVITQAQATIAGLCEQHAAIGSWTLRAADLGRLREAIFRHRIQLEHCSLREYEAALDAVVRIVSQALAGNAARRVIVIGHIDGKQGDWRTHQPATGEPVSQ